MTYWKLPIKSLVIAVMLTACGQVTDIKPITATSPTAPAEPTAVTEIYAAHPVKIVRANGGEVVENPFHPVQLLLSRDESDGALTFYQFTVPPQSAGSPPHVHSLDDEYFIVLSGELSIQNGDKIQLLGEGDFAALTRGNVHMFWNAGDEPVTLIMATTGGSFEAFMAEIAPRLAEVETATPAETLAVIEDMAAEHGIIIMMDKVPEEAAPFYAP